MIVDHHADNEKTSLSILPKFPHKKVIEFLHLDQTEILHKYDIGGDPDDA